VNSAVDVRASKSSALSPIGQMDQNELRTEGHFHAFGRNVLLKNIGETSRLFQMAFFVIVARRFGPAALGNLTVLLMVGSGVGLFVGDMGINTTLVARMSSSRGKERDSIASAALFWKVVLSVAALTVMCVGMSFTRSSRGWLEILAVAVISLGGLWLEFLSAVMNGVNRFDLEVWLRIVYRGAVFGIGSLLALTATLSTDLLYMAVSTAVTLTGAFLLLRGALVNLGMSFRLGTQGKLLWESIPVWMTQLAQLTYLKFDVVILGLLHVAAKETGWYAAAWKVVDVLTAVPALLAVAALPLISGASSEASIAAIVPRYLKAIYVLPFLFALPLAIGADWITHILYGAGFVGTPRVLRVLAWALVPIFVHTFLAVVAIATRRQSEAAKLAVMTSLLGILAAVFLVPRVGYQEMATVCLVANSLFALAMIYRFRDVTASTQFATALKSLGSALGTYALCSYLSPNVHPLVLVFGGLAVYGLWLVVLGVISIGHLRNAWQFAGGLLWNRAAGEASSL
jgi:O-antigen/teichoic acid export membrane protein